MLEEDLLEEIEEAEEATRRILMPTLEGISPMSGMMEDMDSSNSTEFERTLPILLLFYELII